jgi:hypothetical protein
VLRSRISMQVGWYPICGWTSSVTHARYWRNEGRSRQNACPPDVPAELWYDINARYRALHGPALEALRNGPLTSQQIADIVLPGLNAGRMGEVMKLMKQKKMVFRHTDSKRWQKLG